MAEVEKLIEQVPKPKLNEPDKSGLVTISVTLDNIEPRAILIEQVNNFFNVKTTKFTEAVNILETSSESQGLSFLIRLHRELFDTNPENNQELINRNNMIYKFAYDTFMSASDISVGEEEDAPKQIADVAKLLIDVDAIENQLAADAVNTN